VTLARERHTIAFVRLWRATFDPKARVVRHAVAKGFGHGLFAPLVSNVFETLRVSAAVWEHGVEWFTIHLEPNVSAFELEHGIDTERGLYNDGHCREAMRRRVAMRGEHSGYADLFVPIVARGQATSILVSGPFALSRPTATDILGRWQKLTGRQGHPSDPEFASYLAMTLSTLVLDGGKAAAFQRLLRCLVLLMAGEGKADALANEAAVLRAGLEHARHAEYVWEVVRTMVDERSSMIWQSAFRATDLAKLGLERAPDHVLVALAESARPSSDPVDDAVRCHALQRSAVDLAREDGGVIAGQVGDHGVVFLSAASGPAHQRRRKLEALAERASRLARRTFGLSLHFGMAIDPAPLSHGYQSALGAAESALAKGVGIVAVDAPAGNASVSLWDLRSELGHVLEESPERMSARFDRYIEAVALHCGYRMAQAEAQLEIGFERIAEALVGRGVLDEKSFAVTRDGLERAASAARTTRELFSEYRRAVADLSAAVEKAVPARQDRNLRRAVDYIQKHYAEPLRLERVAAVAGFAPGYFSKLFAKRERVPFARYVVGLRLERAKHLLAGTRLDAARVAQLVGFGSAAYFSNVFRRATGATPRQWRQEPRRFVAAGKARKRK
jgi:AraC-like DNA-binding protein